MKQVLYFLNLAEGLWGGELHVHGSTKRFTYPVLQYEMGTPENNFEMPLQLEGFENEYGFFQHSGPYAHTKKCPLWMKNKIRAFFGLKSLKLQPGDTILFKTEDGYETPDEKVIPPLTGKDRRELTRLVRKIGLAEFQQEPVVFLKETVRAHASGRNTNPGTIRIGERLVAFPKSKAPREGRRWKKA